MFLSTMKIVVVEDETKNRMFANLLAEWWQLRGFTGSQIPRRVIGSTQDLGWFCLPLLDVD